MTTPGLPRRTLLTRALRAGALVVASPVAAATAPAALAAPTNPTTSPTAGAITRTGSPFALHIPSAGIDASVEAVWLSSPAASAAPAADRVTLNGVPGEIGLPTSSDAAGWYALSAIPGEPGSTVLVGHVDTVSGPAVFARLPQVRTGTEITLDLLGGSSATFVVDDLRRHPAHLPAPADLFILDGTPRLHLVTCTGRFVRAAGGYQERLIVSATFLPPTPPPPTVLDAPEPVPPDIPDEEAP